MKKIVSSILALLIALTGGYAISDSSTKNSSTGVENQKLAIELERVIDGDTIVFNENGESKKMRLLLIDTPESTTTKTDKVQPFGKESKEFLTDFLTGKNLSVEYEVTQKQEDQYGRILAYLFADGELVQEGLVREGLARVGYEKGQEIYLNDLKEAEQAAALEKKNIWSIKDYVGEYGFNNK
ncbi:micrococcal nuclease [Carnobacterium iners]|uniref:Micrococcal nuclease n=1 Tax=Carnobacterium iners TaxID=1073423 RepID=A0A1X7NP74_9LACT|nr:thermonuclease family protein [Carnobacterium iners]SEK29328.1 micrococcal nuclease [Carnobacterium iners]SMH39788.1 micrococcal nuclease [Carnobacterium iners]